MKTYNSEYFRRLHGNGKKIVFITGWGDDLHAPWVQYFFECAEKRSWDVLLLKIKNEFTNFQEALFDLRNLIDFPVKPVLLSHSMGCIFARYLNDFEQKIYISPFWKIPKCRLILKSEAMSERFLYLFRRLETPIISRGFELQNIGDINLVSQLIPKNISPSTMWQVWQAQKNMPMIHQEDTVLYDPDDTIINTSACLGKHHTEIIAGGHNPFCKEEFRDIIFEMVSEIIN